MKKRLRKKKLVGKFQEFEFMVSLTRSAELSPETWDEQVLDPFIFSFIEGNGLQCGGCSDQNHFEGFVSLKGRGSVTEYHRDLVRSWLENNPMIADWQIGKLVDAWN